MIVVSVQLISAVNGENTELARMVIDNIGGTTAKGNYRVRSLRGRGAKALSKAMSDIPMKVQRHSNVMGHPRLKEHVWNLVAKALNNLGYGQ